MSEKPSYYSIIPASVRYDDELSASEKILYSEISALVNMHGYCFASNGYFAELYNVSKVTVSRWIQSLSARGHIRCNNIMNGKQIEKRQIFIVAEGINENVNRGINKNDKGGINKNVKGNTKEYNTNSIRKNSSDEPMSKMIFSDSRYKDISLVSRIVDSLDMFESHRAEIKKPMTRQAKVIMLRKLLEYHDEGLDVIRMLEVAVERGWMSVYRPPINTDSNKRSNSSVPIMGKVF